MYDFGLIGNCQVSALVSRSNASIDWLCMPRPDSPPVFGRLLDPRGGFFEISPTSSTQSEQHYIKNTNVLETIFHLHDGSKFKVTDFCPRFEQHGRMFRPAWLIRIVEPLKGSPEIKVQCQAINGWSKATVSPCRGNSHLRYEMGESHLRITTNMPLTYLIDETAVSLQSPLFFAMTWDAPIEDDLSDVCFSFLEKTISYWQRWIKHCSIPTLFQDDVIRSALALKLHCYEDTGAILAAITTSLPEEIGEGRNWDYRFCWLRDAFFTLSAFHSLGHFEEMEGFLKFILEILNKGKDLSPLYSLDGKIPDAEAIAHGWQGHKNSFPVRFNNAASLQTQNDVYGEILLTINPIFRDERFYHLRSPELNRMYQWLTEKCISSIGMRDAGIWEIRGGTIEHSFTNLMCWAGVDRVGNTLNAGTLHDCGDNFAAVVSEAKHHAEERLRASISGGVLCNGPTDSSLDASITLLSILNFHDVKLRVRTLESIHEKLSLPRYSNFMTRYQRSDDFGVPQSAFVICSFWLAEALAVENQKTRAVEIIKKTLSASNHLGLFSEHFLPAKKLQLGNFPQCYSHVGLINAAFAVSPNWREVL